MIRYLHAAISLPQASDWTKLGTIRVFTEEIKMFLFRTSIFL